MVKEVEFSNFIELFGNYQYYTNDLDDSPVFDGALEDGGKTLNVRVNIPEISPADGKRCVFLFYGNVDFESKLVDYVKIEQIAESGGIYSFDVSKVLTIPRKVYNTQGTSEITIELYTYEANITTDYGTKRLSVPYSISSDTKYAYDESTDGIYRLFLVDVPTWSSTVLYNMEDVVVHDDVLYISTADNNRGEIPGTGDSWGTPTEEELLDFVYGTTSNTPLASVASDILISRFAKYTYILETIKRTNFKTFDNDVAFQKASLLQMIRERALFYLMNHKAIDAAASLQQLKLAYSNLADTTKIKTHNIKYTT